ncbi:MAG: hypothetical protein IKL33_03430, partial [Alphaproteobacteria bacterium]|nr:hypothetical protein [Alphaproteobacteria bacterium]
MKHKIAISEEKLDEIFASKLRYVNLIDENFSGYQELAEGDKKALKYLVRAAKIMNEVSLEQDNPMNRTLKKELEQEAVNSSHAAKALRLFNCFNGAAG